MAMEKPTPIECLEQGYPMTMARLMLPEDLTREDAIKLLEAEFPQHIIRQCYNFSNEAFFAKLREWGLNKPHASWASSDPYRGKRAPKEPVNDYSAVTGHVPKEPVQPIQEVAPVEDAATVQEEAPEALIPTEKPTAIEWLQQHGTIPDPSEVKVMTSKDWKKDEAAELLKAGATYIQMAAYYGWKGIGSVSYCVKRDGLVGVSANKAFGTQPVKGAETRTDRQVLLPPIMVKGQPPLPDLEDALAPKNDQSAPKKEYERPVITELTEEEKIDLFDHVDDLVDGRAKWSEPITGEAIKQDCWTCDHGEGVLRICNLPTTKDVRECVDAGYRGWIPRETPISEAVHQAAASGEIRIVTKEVPTPAPSIDLASWELVNYKQMQAHTPILRITSKGDGALVSTDLKEGDVVQFRLDPCSEGKRLAVVKADIGRPLRLEKGTNVRLRFSSNDLTRVLAKKGVPLPAAYELEWNEDAQAYVGVLVESKAGVA